MALDFPVFHGQVVLFEVPGECHGDARSREMGRLVWFGRRIVVSTSTERNALLVLMTFYFTRQGFSNVIEPTTRNYLPKEHHVFLLE